MTVELDFDNGLSLAKWFENDQVNELRKDLEERIMQFLFSHDPSSLRFQQITVQLARIGSSLENWSLLEKEISQLDSASSQTILCKGTFLKMANTIGHFFDDHKVEIAVGIGIAAAGVAIGIATGSPVSVAIGGVVVAGANSVFQREEEPNPRIPKNLPPLSARDIEIANKALLPKLEFSPAVNELVITKDGIWVQGQFFPNQVLMQESAIAQEFAKLEDIESRLLFSRVYGQRFKEQPSLSTQEFPSDQGIASSRDFSAPKEESRPSFPEINTEKRPGVFNPQEFTSRKFLVPGAQNSKLYIGWINGINNSFEESKESAAYIQSLAGGHTVSGIYNCSHTPLIDVLEAGLLNYGGYSPNTAKLLQDEWKVFHEANAARPNAKLFQVCHSQGAIHVKNALEGAPQEIRDRVIVFAIAPAAVVPKSLCFKAYNYASEKDHVYDLEPRFSSFEEAALAAVEDPMRSKDGLIILKAHSEAEGWDHSFQGLTYQPTLKDALEDYKQHGGEYLPEEKEFLE